jgi:hypothetical protein
VAVTGCSSSGKKAGSASTPRTTAPASSASTSAATSSSAAAAPAPTGTGAPADAGTKAAVAKAYTTFFDPKASAAQSQAALQHGASFAATLEAAAKSSAAQGIAATVSAVNSVSPNVAFVTFSLTSKGSTLLSDTTGYAVRDGGTWKVAAQTFCNLLQLQGTAPAACKDPAITALPA